jgi:formyl-CoA transferase
MENTPAPPPLSGIFILDLSRVLAGPFATMMLADLGATVIKVERPSSGDDTRHWGPPWAGGESAYYLSVNRNKKSVTLDLKQERARDILRVLAQRADVLVENWRAGTMDAWGIGYEDLKPLNPGLIYCAITGYGQTGPNKDRAGYDAIIQAEGGLMSITGPSEGPPMKVPIAIVDITAGMLSAIAILSALYDRVQSGQGQYIDMSLLDAQLAWLVNIGSNYLISGEPPERFGNAHPNIVPYQPFATADGWIVVGVGNERHWMRLCALANWADLESDKRFASNSARVENRDILIPELEGRFKSRTSEEWLARLRKEGIPCGPINAIEQVFSDPQVVARDMLVRLAHPTAGEIKIVGTPFKLSRTSAQITTPPPLLGQHTEEVLREHLEMEESDIDELRNAGVI